MTQDENGGLSNAKGTATERMLVRDAILSGSSPKLEVFYVGDDTWTCSVEWYPGQFAFVEGKGAADVLRVLAEVLEEG